jgi:hypothetical protein
VRVLDQAASWDDEAGAAAVRAELLATRSELVDLRQECARLRRLVAADGTAEPRSVGAIGRRDSTHTGGLGTTVSVVIPAKNESANLRWVLERIPPYVHEIIVIDGHSIDDTASVALRSGPNVLVVPEAAPGKGSALRTGFERASGDIIVMLDADGSMRPQEMGRYISLLGDGFDLVKGSRFMAGGGSSDITTLRRIGNRHLIIAVNLLFGSHFTDLCYGFCAFHRRHLDVLSLDAPGFEIEAQLIVRALRAGLCITEVPSVEEQRRSGESQLRSVRDGVRVLRTILRERRRVASPVPDDVVIDLTDDSTTPHHPAALGEPAGRPRSAAEAW